MDWQVIVTLIIAIITAFVAYLNYRTRPLLVRTKEKHSEDLKRVLKRWLAELGAEGGTIAPLFHRERPCRLHLSVEQDPLFPDLEEHMPEGADLLSQWQNLKNACDPYDSGRSRLYDRIHNDMQSVGQGLFVAEFFAENFAELIYEEASRLARGEPQRSLDEYFKMEQKMRQTPDDPKPWFQSTIYGWTLASGESEQQVTMAKSYLTAALENLSQPGTREAGYVDEAKRLKGIEDTLIEQNEKLLQSIKDVLAIPILTGNCRYIKRATESFFPFNVKRVFRTRLRSARRGSQRQELGLARLGKVKEWGCILLLASDD
jgi:hypothetical protein